MSRHMILRKGTTEQIKQIVLLDGEIVFDTTEKRLVVGDGVIPGGIPMARLDEITKKVAKNGK